MKKLTFLLFVTTLFFSVNSILAQNYSRVKVYADEAGIVKIASLGIPVEGEIKKGVFLISDFSDEEIKLLRDNQFKCEILIDDVKSYYKNRTAQSIEKLPKSLSCNKGVTTYQTPVNWSQGSMGGFYTYSEILAELDNMATLFPTLITVKQACTATNTLEGRPIWWVKISDNPNISEAEPKVLFTALHHAREPQGMQQLIFYMYYLLENYNTNSEVHALVDNTEMFFIPCVNPDGYHHNEVTDPGGGGMWRKNRNGQGIDINRNYGYNWGYDNTGSSPNPSDETYRGASAFSENETQNIRDFCTAHDIKLTMNYHAYGNDMIYPWGYIGSFLTPDSLVFEKYGNMLTKEDLFINGTCDQTLGYITNGDADDWMYGEQVTKNKIYAFTPEVGEGGDGFWPLPSRILPLCNLTIYQDFMATKLVGKYAVTTDESPTFISQQSGYLKFGIQRLGLDSPATFTVSIIPISNITSVGSPKVFTAMNLLENRNDSISYVLNPSIICGQKIKYVLEVNNGFYSNYDTITKIYGPSVLILNDNCNTMTNWSSSGWGTTNEDYYSATDCITDSPYANYSDNENSSITLNSSIDLTHSIAAVLSFYARWHVESAYDYVQLKASVNGGSTWTPLCGNYTHPGGANQAYGEPLYDSWQRKWVKEEVNLEDYLGQNVKLRFTIVTDNGGDYDGFYFDDVKILVMPDSANAINHNDGTGNIFVSDPMPNPASESFSVYINCPANSGDALFCIYNTNGQQILNKQLHPQQNRITVNTDSWRKGVYYYYLKTEKNISVIKKVIVY